LICDATFAGLQDGVDAPGESAAGASRLAPVAMLVRAAVESDDPEQLLAVAASLVGRPLGLAAGSGRPLGAAPDDERGARALEVASTASRSAAGPRGWSVRPVGDDACFRARLAVGPAAAREPVETHDVLEVLSALLSEQLTRVALKRAQTEVLVRRLVSDPDVTVEQLRFEAEAIGIVLARAYLAAIVVWRGSIAPRMIDGVRDDAEGRLPDALVARLDRRLIILAPAANREATVDAVQQVVARLRALAPSSCAQAIIAETGVRPGSLAGCLHDLALPEGAPASDDPPVVSAGRYALERLLRDSLPTGEAARFVEDRLGRLIAWDHRHGSSLLRVLEAALDLPHLDEAARRCYMHRNTFRRHLRQATELLRAELDDPNVRLAVHVALKLRRALPSA
jgi:sugar diacid utilization regulator